MDVLVVSAGGLLGSNVISSALERGLSAGGSYHSTRPDFEVPLREFDIRDTAKFEDILGDFNPSIVVNCAAMTDVDTCEQSPERAHEINAAAPESLARLCSEQDTNFAHISTDYIFDGESGECYREDAEPNPIQEYGRSKLAGERAVRSVHESPLVIRPSFVYGVNRSAETPQVEGFPAWVNSRLTSGQDLPLFTDQYVTPSRAESTAETLLDLLFDGATGPYHVAARYCVTPYEFGRIIATQLGVKADTLAESSQTGVDRDAARPSNTCLSVEKVETRLGRSQPTVKQGVRALEPYL
jgi:dTDP-4-dehydrorhamnose reductase